MMPPRVLALSGQNPAGATTMTIDVRRMVMEPTLGSNMFSLHLRQTKHK